MQIKTSYRLRSYRIIEYENGLLRWKTHYDFGVHRSGECFICRNVLFAGKRQQEERGERFPWPHWFKEHHREHHSRSNIQVLTLLLLFFLGIALPFNGAVRAEEEDKVLEKSGIHYPGGFDPNTVGEVQGRASHFFRPGKGPVRFQLSTDRETYMVLTSPFWYWNEIQIRISDGTEVIVRGSKSFGKDGNLYIVAQEIRLPFSGQYFVFRGKNGFPLWKGSGWSGRGSSGEFNPSSVGTGGFGAGGGSSGHGRR